ncbi:diacylglycerol kinase family protein, partial [Kineosporia sp. A_224]|uniref:diacylglycerol/lipid kinase family protein n=1 Tax=Kineosporia sp. A_224 TaxID=1962180 RepID=UPI001179EBAC
VLHVLSHRPGALLVSMVLFGLSMVSARVALQPLGRRPSRDRRRPHGHRPARRVPRGGRAVLLVNCRSGSGKAMAEITHRADRECVEIVLVAEGQDLSVLADAVAADGAGILGVAGGDGSMAAVAAVASRRGLPFVCVPTGTRNHFALDLGIDPADISSAVSAFRGENDVRVDLGEVNGRIFVNNVSLGLYAGLLASRHYRRSKMRAVLDELPALVGPDARPPALRFAAPQGMTQDGTDALLVSNNPYRLGGLGRSAWRPDLASGTLGVLTIRLDDGNAIMRLAAAELLGRGRLPAGYDRWTTDTFAVDADGPIDAAVDGEPVRLSGVLRFAVRPGALVVRRPPARRREAAGRLVREARLLLRTASAPDHPDRPPSSSEGLHRRTTDKVPGSGREGVAGWDWPRSWAPRRQQRRLDKRGRSVMAVNERATLNQVFGRLTLIVSVVWAVTIIGSAVAAKASSEFIWVLLILLCGASGTGAAVEAARRRAAA